MASVRKRVGKRGETTWAVLYRHGGKQCSKAVTSEKGAEKLVALMDQFGVEKALQFVKDAGSAEASLTIDELFTKWIVTKNGDVTVDTVGGYIQDYEKWIKPYLGHREAAMIDELDVQEWVDKIRVVPSKATGKPLSAKSVADRHALLHQMYDWGSEKKRLLVPRNPCKETKLPRRAKTNPKGLRLPELHRLLEAGDGLDQEAADLVAFMAGTGWRISESIALPRWAVEEVDLPSGDVAVYVTMGQVLRRHEGVVTDAKSAASLGRRLRVLGPGAAVLRRRIVGLGPNDFVFTFTDARPGIKTRAVRPWNVNSFRALRWPRLVAAAGLEDRGPTPHWLRHTHVALCIAAGLSLAEIQRRLGHEDIKTTINIYGRMLEEMSDELAARADALFVSSPLLVGPGVVVGALA